MNKLNTRMMRGLLSLSLLSASLLPQVGGQTHHSRRRTPAPTMATSQPQHPKFQLDCTLPALTVNPIAIDNDCGNKGDSDSASAAQNEIKNRFCLPGDPTTPMDIDFATFDALQKAAKDKHIPFGRKMVNGESVEDLPPDRSVLIDLFTDGQGRQLGEGKLVTLEGFIFKAKHSNTFVDSGSLRKGGESVNCHAKTLAGNDIHIALARTKAGTLHPSESSECETVTAEITPHHRRAIYNRFDTTPKDFLNGAVQKPGQDKLKGHPLPLQGARVRVTGQLFFDAAHSPCVNGHGGPARRSIWEIHPVFAIDVFEATQHKFIPFEQWAQLHSH
jgi:hypothetical protein